ncbi:hypothetical protein [Oryza sativa Japonica Group]|uniref:Uncharacterized protein n=1 Tax=Oryza sativa subsp. japonica TaxID=39947 RepID=Q5N8E5_ORYSJ|nr:hypothetical protein [Oryza sativa Japonica Group]BAD82261.1 hypothetical protein [Oryza sativa Japonica Group]
MWSTELVAGDGRGGGAVGVVERQAAGGQKATAGDIALAHHWERQHGRRLHHLVVHQSHHGHGGARGSVVVHLLARLSSSSTCALADSVSTTSSARSSSATSPSHAHLTSPSRARCRSPSKHR